MSRGDVGVNLSRARVGVTEQDLDHAHVHPLLHEVCGERVAKGAGRDALGDAGAAYGDLEGALHGGVMDGTNRVLHAREQQARRTSLAPPLAGQFESDRRQRDITVFVSLGLTDVEEHAGRVDVGDREAADLAEAETSRIEDGQNDPVAQGPDRAKDGQGLAG